MEYQVAIIARCRKCGCGRFELPESFAADVPDDAVGVIVRYKCAECGAKGPKLSPEHYDELGYPPHGMSLVGQRVVTPL